MSRIESLLGSPLFTQARMRRVLWSFIETKFPDISTSPLTIIFDSEGNFNSNIYQCIIESRAFVGFEHNVVDKIFQRHVFIFLLWSNNQFPEMQSWESFLQCPQEEQQNQIITGIQFTWDELQNRRLVQELLTQ
jgi:hypothetical protein